MPTSWKSYALFGNGWNGPITNLTVTHMVTDPNNKSEHTDTIASGLSLGVGEVTPVVQVTTFEDQDDTWRVTFTDAAGTVHAAKEDWDFHIDDAGGIIFLQATSEDEKLSMYLPVSSDQDTDI